MKNGWQSYWLKFIRRKAKYSSEKGKSLAYKQLVRAALERASAVRDSAVPACTLTKVKLCKEQAKPPVSLNWWTSLAEASRSTETWGPRPLNACTWVTKVLALGTLIRKVSSTQYCTLVQSITRGPSSWRLLESGIFYLLIFHYLHIPASYSILTYAHYYYVENQTDQPTSININKARQPLHEEIVVVITSFSIDSRP